MNHTDIVMGESYLCRLKGDVFFYATFKQIEKDPHQKGVIWLVGTDDETGEDRRVRPKRILRTKMAEMGRQRQEAFAEQRWREQEEEWRREDEEALQKRAQEKTEQIAYLESVMPDGCTLEIEDDMASVKSEYFDFHLPVSIWLLARAAEDINGYDLEPEQYVVALFFRAQPPLYSMMPTG